MTHSLNLTSNQVQDLRGILISAEQDRASLRRRASSDDAITLETAMVHARQAATTKLILEQLDLDEAEREGAVSNLRRMAGATRLAVTLGTAPHGLDWLSVAVECDAIADQVNIDIKASAATEG
ncbi:hypothetical protein [Promicromonospora sp. NFX87]|uniref:hypothetical protein n=1 Tax=Promicromonospora sp. NFX87 TaxID=3402691 RepID=UPI003AFAC807